MKILENKSWQALIEIAAEANKLALELKATEPSYKEAIQAGIKCYEIVSKPYLLSYEGDVTVTDAFNDVWRCIGFPATDKKTGYIQFTRIRQNKGF